MTAWHSMAEFWNSPAGKYTPRIAPMFSEVEPDEAFKAPRLSERIAPKEAPDWLEFFIIKSLAGFGGNKPTTQEFIAWFQPGAHWPPHTAAIIRMVMSDIHRYRMGFGFWQLRDTLGLSIREIASAMRRAGTRETYPCLWINQYAWNAPVDGRVMIGGRWKPITEKHSYAGT